MFNKDTKVFTDMMSEGLIFIDNKGKIQIYNNKAKEIFGINSFHSYSHSSGKLESGDIVIIGDTALGKDDGNLTIEALEIIGIKNSKITYGDAFVAIGTYKDDENLPLYKSIERNAEEENLVLNKRYLDLSISASVNFKEKNIEIDVCDNKYVLSYINYIGHMVVIDGKTKELKFYQDYGYTARNESIYDLLEGKTFRAKGIESEDFDVIGKDIFEIHSGGNTIDEFYEAATGKDIKYLNEFKEINGRPTMCTLSPIDENGERIGAVLKVEDISEMKKVIRERDEALLNLELMEKKFKEGTKNNLMPEIIGESKEILYVKNLAMKASQTNSTVLLLGESGTGKTMIAKAIHNNSKIKDKPFIHVNCGSIPENLLESELFGYDRGAFTGAKTEGKSGMFELARGGTIFLDEIGEISLTLQVKLLQVLQDKSFFKIGGDKNIEVDVRIIVATNKNLEEEMMNGRFREDLYYRINVFPIWIPPLRERKQDIYPLVQHILPNICNKIGYETKRISGEALGLLNNHEWQGNIRELENVLERSAHIAEGNTILSKHLSINRRKQQGSHEFTTERGLREILMDFEKQIIASAIVQCNGDRKNAMELLQIGKTNFYDKIKKYDL